MSGTFKGIISILISALFFFPWVWMDIFSVNLSATSTMIVGLTAALIATLLGMQARKQGAAILGMIGLVLGSISIILNIVNLVAVLGR